MRAYIALGVGIAIVALIAGLIVTKGQLEKRKEDVTRLEMVVSSQADAIRQLKARETTIANTANGQAEQAAVVCQGTGAELFERGKQIGLATCAAR
jgi:hypothetical protein